VQLLPTQRLGLHCVAECTKGAPRSAQPKDPARNYDCPNADTSGDSRSGCPTVPPRSHLAKLSFRMLSQRGTRNTTAGARHWSAATDSPYTCMHECTTRALHSSSICMPAAGPKPPQGPRKRTHNAHKTGNRLWGSTAPRYTRTPGQHTHPPTRTQTPQRRVHSMRKLFPNRKPQTSTQLHTHTKTLTHNNPPCTHGGHVRHSQDTHTA
jgi:hypothetical protein